MGASSLAFAALLGISCSTAPALESLHAALVCTSRASVACPASERTAAFDRWARAAIRRPGSTFSVWTDEPGSSPREEFTACIPERWGAGVLEAKASFLREGRQRAALGGAHLPEGCMPTEEVAGNVTVLDGDRRFHLATGGEPRHLAVACDRSDSMLGISCDTAALRSAFDGWLAESGGAPGSVFSVYGIGRSRDSAERLVHVSVIGRPAGERVALLLATRERLAASLEAAPRGSAIAEAVSVAATDLRHGTGIRSLLVLSDLRQVTPRTWNFEIAAPAPAVFIEWLRASGLAEDLRGISVRACGLHHRRAPGARHYDALLASRVEKLWTVAFESMKADLVELRSDCEPETLALRRQK